MTMIPTRHSKTFFSEKRANALYNQLIAEEAENVYISIGLDAFGQTQYRVHWDNKEEN